MKNGCNDLLEAKIAERTEHAKKLYRYVTDVARRVGDMTAASRSISDLFSTKLEVQRQKLRDNCEKLLFHDPVNYGRKSLELLWRKVYYETVSMAKKLRETDTENDSYLFTHIVCGIGHFHHFIARIETEMKVQFKELDYTCSHLDGDIKADEESSGKSSEDEAQFGRSALHSCLIYLGDLIRYQVEIFQSFEPSIAARYYLQAAHVDMSSGMPYNQLGNLYQDKNYNLDSVCYYIQCLSCVIPFDGAMGNLTKIFEKNIQYTDIENSESLSQAEHIQNTIANFLSLIEIWYLSKNDTNIPQRCSTIAHELKIAMDFTKSPLPDINKNYIEYTQAVEEENSNPSYLNSNLVHKIVLICLFTITKLSETDEVKAFACKAFSLALLSQLFQKLLKQLQSFGLKNPASKYKPRHNTTLILESSEKNEKPFELGNETPMEEMVPPESNGIKSSQEENKLIGKDNPSEDKELLVNGDAKGNLKKASAKRRRRRRLMSSDSSDMSDADTGSSDIETYESCSDEELSESTGQSEDDSLSEDSCNDATDVEQSNGKLEEGTTNKNLPPKQLNGDVTAKGDIENVDDKINKDTKNELDVQGLQNFLLGDNFLASIKLLQDWALNEKDLILSCGDSGESLFQCVVDLLNIFTFYFCHSKTREPNEDKCHILEYARSVSKKFKLEYKTIPLPEDINLRGTSICKFDKDAAEWQILEKYKLSLYEENVIRILNFVDFGNHVAKIIPRIRFNRSLKIFYLKKTPPHKVNTKLNHKRSREWHNSKKTNAESSEGGLLRRLGRLWLASRVRELERSGRRAAAAPAPALLALHTGALHTHLRRVKHLLRANNFILLIPAVVLQELDDLKRDQSTARDAIRWLEVQLRSGSRFLRVQRPGQCKPLPLMKYPRKAPQHIHNYIQILEFCNHYLGEDKQIQGGNGDPDNSLQSKSTPLLILLVGNEPGSEDEQYKEFSVTGAAQAAGISVEYIGDFYAKWRHSVHKNGKKR